MRIATDTLTTYLAVEVYNLVSEQGVAGFDTLMAQGWYPAEIQAYFFAGKAAA